MSTNPARRNAIEAIASQPRLQGSFDFRNEKIDLIYGQNVFSLSFQFPDSFGNRKSLGFGKEINPV
jgi:hypothetical protein